MTNDLIDHIVGGEHSKANSIFDKMLQDKIDTAMEQEKIAVANSMFNDEDNDDEVDAEEEATLEQEVDLSDELEGVEADDEEEVEEPEAEAQGDTVEQE